MTKRNPGDTAPESTSEKTIQPFWKIVTENIECLAIAIVMALMLKFFLVEAYKIPTGSMQPTIFGNEDTGLFDRVLVNKFLYFLDEPKRWDIIVFRYPLDQSKNYIKRLVGLPGEEVTIKNGDIYINGKIERKPECATEAMLKMIYPEDIDNERLNGFFNIQGEHEITDPGCIIFSSQGKATSRKTIKALYKDGYNPDYNIPRPNIGNLNRTENQAVGDIRLAFNATLHGEGGGIRVHIEEEGKEHTFFLKGDGNPVKSYVSTTQPDESGMTYAENDRSHRTELPDISLEKNNTYELVFTNVDDCLSIHINGKMVIVHEYDSSITSMGNPRNMIEFETTGCGCTFDDITVFRDIYYTTRFINEKENRFDVPDGHYFALGDNTQNSLDSRLWKSATFSVDNGTDIKCNFEKDILGNVVHPKKIANGYALTDIYGDNRIISTSSPPPSKYEHFIPKKLMLGKALAVFWPIVPHFRWKLLR